MRPGTLGDTTIDNELSFAQSQRRSTNFYNQPSTSRGAAQMIRITPTARKSTSRYQQVTDNRPKGAARRKMGFRQREMKQLKEIARLQKMTKCLIPKAPFARVIREISLRCNPEITRYTITALEALQEATEMFLTQALTDSYLLTLHRKCVTLTVGDMALMRALKLNF